MRPVIACGCLLALIACGRGSAVSTPTTPTTPTPTPTPQANRAPVINSLIFLPAFGVLNLTTFFYSATASDPEGDAVSYSWNIAGTGSSSASGSIAFKSAGSGSATVTVTDGKGASVSSSRSFVVATMAGAWTGTLAGAPFTMTLAQPTGGTVSGTWTLPGTPYSGHLDPAAVNRIDANANVSLRCKVTAGGGDGGSNDFTLTGKMDATGLKLTGTIQGSGFTGQSFTLTK
jgi:hypothetical protein